MEPVAEAAESARLVVIGDADWLGDLGARLMGQEYAKNLEMLENLIDWSLLDETLLEIRARGGRDRPLDELTKEEKRNIQIVNYAAPVVLVLVLGIFRWSGRRRAERRRGGRKPVAQA